MTRLLLGVALLLLPSLACGQSRKVLEDKRKNLMAAIRSTNQALSDTRQNKIQTLERYLALQRQIEQRQELIQTIEAEIELYDQNIVRNKAIITTLDEEIKTLYNEYAIMARAAFRQQRQRSDIFFLFSATGWNNFLQRWRYLQQHSEYRERQIILIAETKEMRSKQVIQLEQQRAEKAEILGEQRLQQQQVSEELEVKDNLLQSLKKVERKLARALAQQQRDREQLSAAIEEIIGKDVVANQRKPRRPIGQKRSTPIISDVPNSKTSSFEDYRGRLDPPVEHGTIVRHFGRQPHPTATHLMITNNGIDIRTTTGAKVKSVFEGRVVGKKFIPSYKHMIIVQHQGFYTVYSNLEEVFVQKGEAVKRGQIIGVVDAVKQEVHFELWKGKQRLNPTYWLKN
ncbi:MAG: peptidoglycan DD-metalloendopeptidase family protein [Bacteroidota bacterium]